MEKEIIFPTKDDYEIIYLEAYDLAESLNTALLDLKTNEFFLCITYRYDNGYPILCGKYTDHIGWVPWEEKRYIFIKQKVSSRK